jgi:hypothetical protein
MNVTMKSFRDMIESNRVHLGDFPEIHYKNPLPPKEPFHFQRRAVCSKLPGLPSQTASDNAR